MGRVGFRSAYADTAQDRVLDVTMHLLAMAALPGAWWFQLLPDVVLPYLWLAGMWTDRFEPEWSLPLGLHRTLHLRGALQVPALVALMLVTLRWPALGGMWLAHVAIDSVTHGEGWQ